MRLTRDVGRENSTVSMKAIVWSEDGAPEDVLEPQEVDEPVVGDNEVLVRIRATTVAGDAWHLVRGLPYLARIATRCPRLRRTLQREAEPS